MNESSTPLFQQVADLIADAIVDGSLPEGERAPSTNELAEFHSITPQPPEKGWRYLSIRACWPRGAAWGCSLNTAPASES